MELTIEQALANLQSACDNLVAKKADHIALELSMRKIRETIQQALTSDETKKPQP